MPKMMVIGKDGVEMVLILADYFDVEGHTNKSI
jgi:hypothetical protein